MKRKIRGSSAGKTAYEIARDKAEAGEDDDDGKMMSQPRTVLCAFQLYALFYSRHMMNLFD